MKTKTPPRAAPGYSLLELLVTLAIIIIMATVALPNINGYRQEASLLGAAQGFKAEFMKTRSLAARRNCQTAIRFEEDSSGQIFFSTYRDGNSNGVLSADIAKGIDERVSGPFRLDGGQPGVEAGVLPGAPAPPPDRGTLSSEPIRFGSARMVSFSPLGTGTPGTFYLRNRTSMACVRVTGGSARVRVMVLRGKIWVDRQG